MIYGFTFALFATLVALAIIDFRTYRLPDILTLPLIAIGALQAWLLNSGWIDSLTGAALGYSAFVIIELVFKAVRKRDGLGRGDAKLLAAGGAWCGWAGLPLIVLIGSAMALTALIFPGFRARAKDGYLPFGPFLALAIGCVWAATRLM